MKKLFTLMLSVIFMVLLSFSSFATIPSIGTYRPFGLAGYTSTSVYGDDYCVWDSSYDNLITISYADANMIIATKSNETISYVCFDPINNPDVYYSYVNGEVSYDGINVSSAYGFTFLRDVPPLNRVYFYEYIFVG